MSRILTTPVFLGTKLMLSEHTSVGWMAGTPPIDYEKSWFVKTAEGRECCVIIDPDDPTKFRDMSLLATEGKAQHSLSIISYRPATQEECEQLSRMIMQMLSEKVLS